LTILEKALGPDHRRVGASLNNLALLYCTRGQYEKAVRFNELALTISEQTLGPDHSDVGACLNNLAKLYHDQGRYEKAKPLY
jgi:tetratricopeptide (TPR) repeat protein